MNISENFVGANKSGVGYQLSWTITRDGGDFDFPTDQFDNFSNAARNLSHTTSQIAEVRAEQDVAGVDMYAQVTMAFADASNNMGVMVRFSASARTYYMASIGPGGNLTLRRVVDGDVIFGNIGEWYGIPVAMSGDVLRLEVKGSQLTAKLNGRIIGQVTDSVITSGKRGGIMAAAVVAGDLFTAWSAGVEVDKVSVVALSYR